MSNVFRFSFSTLRFTAHKPLLLILAIFTLLTVYNSALLPLGEAADETDHYQYLRFVAQTGHPPLTQTERAEAGFKGGLAPLYYWLAAWPIAWVGEETPPDIRRVDSRPERHLPTDGLGINHLLHTLDEQWPWRGQILAWHLVRLLSLPVAWVTIIATYALARRLLPEQKFVAGGAAAFVAFLPRFVISSAVINDDNLVFALTALLLLTQVIILQGRRGSLIFATFGALFGLALVTKYFSLILIPEILFTLFIYLKSAHPSLDTGSQRRTAGRDFTGHAFRSIFQPPILFFVAALLLTAGPWFIFIVARFNRIDELGLIPGLAASLGEPQITEGLAGLLAGQSVRPPAATYSLGAWLGLLYRSFWFEYGWMQIFAPAWVYALFTIFLLAALAGLIPSLKQRITARRSDQRPIPAPPPTGDSQQPDASRHFPLSPLPHLHAPLLWLLALHLTLFIIVVLARYILSATIDTGQGRHLYPALPVIALMMAWGFRQLRILKLTFKSRSNPLPATGYLLPTTCYLLPALLTLLPPLFILPHYPTLPVTTTPPARLPISYRQAIPVAGGLSLAGFDVAGTASAGQALPVTLYWRAEREANQDYLVSLCLQDQAEQPVACWRGHFAGGRYPARAWEAGDTLADTVYIPIPVCYRLPERAYRLRLELWPLAPDAPGPVPEAWPALAQTFAEPLISIRASDSRLNLPQTVEVWRAGQRLNGPAPIELNEALAQITYGGDQPGPVFEMNGPDEPWRPVPSLETPLYLPCDDGPRPFAHLSHFIAGPTLLPGDYRPGEPAALPNLVLSLNSRRRALKPVQAGLSFAGYLAPLSLQLAGHPEIDLAQFGQAAPPHPAGVTPAIGPHSILPVTIRWQARRWMADPLVISLKLLDKDFLAGGERIATLGDRYPNVLWVPGEVVEETYPLRLRPGAPPGLYRLELSLVHQDKSLPDGFEYLPVTGGQASLGHNLYPATVRLLDPAYNQPPSQPFQAQLGPNIQLTGYDLSPSPGSNLQSPIFLTLYWQSRAKIPTDYTVFTQLLGPDGQVWAQWDNPPQAGRYPTSAWAASDSVVDRYSLTLRQGAPPGEYRLLVGMYDPASGARLPAVVNGQPQPNQAIELARLTLRP